MIPRPPPHRLIGGLGFVAPVALGMLGALHTGCATPLHDYNDGSLIRAIRRSSERELAQPRMNPEAVVLTREDRVRELQLDPAVLDELSAMAGPDSYKGDPLPLGPSLFGHPQEVAPITLQRAVLSCVRRNLNVEFARLAPAISQAQLSAAEAAFDWVFFGNTSFARTNEPRVSQNFSTVNSERRDVFDAAAGIRKPLISGGTLTIQTQFTSTDFRTPGVVFRPNPADENNIVIQLDQPLLRNFGSDVTQAEVRLARDTELDSIQQLKTTLLEVVTSTESAYWNLVRARSDLLVAQRLLNRTDDVARVLRERRVFDAKPAVVSDAVRAVEARRAEVLRAQRTLLGASDALKQLMNDPEFPVGAEILLIPADAAVDQALEFNLLDALRVAFQNRPEMWRAILSMDSASIRQAVADNGRLPLLNLRALTRISGLGQDPADAYDQLVAADFVDYQVGVTFEQPIGNREKEAEYRQRRLERMQTVIVTRSIVQQIVLDVKNSLRDVVTNYALIEQNRAARIAAAENLRTLQVEEQAIQGLTPEFLNLKLQRQLDLAAAEQQETFALTEYNASLARFYQATGRALERNNIDFAVPNLELDPRTSDLFPDTPTEKQRERTDPQLKKVP